MALSRGLGLLEQVGKWSATLRVPRLRTMREFAEQEIKIPDGPFKGRRWRVDRQPYAGLLFDAIESGQWNRIAGVGPTQSGKTLHLFIIPALYYLHEYAETAVCGVPDMDMAGDKWRVDLLPVIESNPRFRANLPAAGGGSRGGKVETIKFVHGPELKFMSGGGGDKSRAGYTSRILLVTEVDGMDTIGGASREADKIEQLEARTMADYARRRVFLECTASIDTGRIWREYTGGTESRIVLPCPHCGAYVDLGRDDLVGWREAKNEVDAAEKAHFRCSECKAPWNEAERHKANLRGKLLHRGQEIDAKGNITGDPPQTATLGFRWSAVNNLFMAAGSVGAEEWKAAHAEDDESAERKLCQFIWAMPFKSPHIDLTQLRPDQIARRVVELPRAVCPLNATMITVAMDLGKWTCHWMAIAWTPDGSGHVVDYGRIEVASNELGVERALTVACCELRDMCAEGWPVGALDAPTKHVPAQVWIDAGWETDVVYEFMRDCYRAGLRHYRPAMGLGFSQHMRQRYNRPKTTGAITKAVGEGWHLSLLKKHQMALVEINADQWKTWLHERLAVPVEAPGALSLFQSLPQEHYQLGRHLTAERPVEEYDPQKGTRIVWKRIHRDNHWLDAGYMAAAAANLCGVRLEMGGAATGAARQAHGSKGGARAPAFTTPDGRAFLATERE